MSGLKFRGCAKADRCVFVYRQIHPFPRLCDRSDRTGRVPGARRKQKCAKNYGLTRAIQLPQAFAMEMSQVRQSALALLDDCRIVALHFICLGFQVVRFFTDPFGFLSSFVGATDESLTILAIN